MSSLSEKIQNALPFFSKHPKMSAQEALTLKPMRNPSVKWGRDQNTNLVVLSYRREGPGSMDKWIGRIFSVPTDRKIEMTDELSSLVWELCDGEHTVMSISGEIASKYKLSTRQAQVSVLAFLNTLEKKRLVGAAKSESVKHTKSALRKSKSKR